MPRSGEESESVITVEDRATTNAVKNTDRGGVNPEPWHLSYAPVSVPALESLSLSMLRQVLEASSIAGKQQVLGRLPEIYTRFLLAIDGPSAC